MSWSELEKNHMKELEEFEKLRIESWDKLQKRQTEIRAAFGEQKNVPDYVQKRLEREKDIWQKRWGNKGTKRTALSIKHSIENKNLLLKLLNEERQQVKKKDKGFDL